MLEVYFYAGCHHSNIKKNKKIDCFDVEAKQLLGQMVGTNKAELNVSELKSEIYFVKLFFDNGSVEIQKINKSN